jgi:hypothetical protein
LLHICLPYINEEEKIDSDVNQKAKDDKNQTINKIAKDDEKEEKKIRESRTYGFKPCICVCPIFFRYEKTHI